MKKITESHLARLPCFNTIIIEDDIFEYLRKIPDENDACYFGYYYSSPLLGTSVGVKGVALQSRQLHQGPLFTINRRMK